MFKDTKAFSGFAVDDLDEAREFYEGHARARGLDARWACSPCSLDGGARPTLIYPKPDFEPATYTILNFPVDDIDAAVDALTERGVAFEIYEGFGQDEQGHRPLGRRPADRVVPRPGGQHPLGPGDGLVDFPEIRSHARRSLSPRWLWGSSAGSAAIVAGFADGSGSCSAARASIVSRTSRSEISPTSGPSTKRCPRPVSITMPSNTSALASASTCATTPIRSPSAESTGVPSLKSVRSHFLQ